MTSTDLLLGVINAADPVRYRQAISALEKHSGAMEAAALAGPNPVRHALQATRPALHTLPPTRHNTTDAGTQFEAYVLQTFIEPMLPSGEGLYGGGVSAGFWKSMLAEKLAGEIARSGGIGIAEHIRR